MFACFYNDCGASCWGHRSCNSHPTPSQKIAKIGRHDGSFRLRAVGSALSKVRRVGPIHDLLQGRRWSSLVRRQVGTKNTTVFGQASSTVLNVVCNRNFPSLPSRIWWFIQKWEMSNQDWRFLYRKRLCPFAGAAGKWKVAIWDHFLELPLEVEQPEVQTSEQWYLLSQSNLAKHQWHHTYQSLQMKLVNKLLLSWWARSFNNVAIGNCEGAFKLSKDRWFGDVHH